MKSFSKLVYPYIVWMIGMIIVPMLMIVLYAFTVQGNSVLTLTITFDNFARFFSDPILLVRTYAWKGILGRLGVPGEISVYVGMVYNFLPFMILQIYTALSKIDASLITAAHDLGADEKQTFLRVTLPLSLSGVVSGITLVFLPAVSSFFIPKLLGGGQYVLIGNLIEDYFVSTGDWNFGSAISLIMAVIILISMYVTRKLDKDVKEK